MLISFSVENFRSIRDLQTLSLESRSTDDHLLGSNTAEAGNRRLGKVAAIYGPNGSGKSNVIKAIAWFKNFVLSSSKDSQVGEKIAVEPFLLSDFSANQPSHFEIEYFWKGFEYCYGFTATSEAIQTEWLFRKQPKVKKTRLFTREDGKISPSSDYFKEGKGLENRTRNNALFLSVCAQFAGPEAIQVLQWFHQLRCISGIHDRGYLPFTIECLRHEAKRTTLVEFARKADLNLVDLNAKEVSENDLPSEIPSEIRQLIRSGKIYSGVKTVHHVRNLHGEVVDQVEFDLKEDESEGTQKFIALSGPITDTIQEGSILVIDELEAQLHPKLTQAILDLFQSAANQRNAQLVCATHDVTLLEPDRFRRDQVWFCEKAEDGATTLFSLAEFDPQKVRSTTNFSRQYMMGIFGAVPKLAHFQEALTHVVKEP